MLGRLQARSGGCELELGGPKQRAVLALLLLRANEPLAADWLIEELWDGGAPATARTALQVYISQLRRALGAADDGDALITREGPCYTLRLPEERIDAHRFEALLAASRGALAAGRTKAALDGVEQALALWQGEPLADLRYHAFAQTAIARLSALRLDALELQLEATLALGDAARAVALGEALAEADPLRERAWELLMLALYRAGRPGDALAVYTRARSVLREALGTEPGRPLRRLQQRILVQDERLEPAPAQPPLRLPSTASSFIGRGRDIEALAGLLERDARLVTLTGAPGVGKSRLALETARSLAGRFRDGIWWVPLAAVAEPRLVAASIARALEVPELPGRSAREGLERHLAGRELLLVLDNLEHLLDEAPLLAALLAAAPALRILATSRVRLRLSGEQRYAVSPLTLPSPTGGPDAAACEAVALFEHRARSVEPRFHLSAANVATVASVCVRLDGLPLAIELAAARLDELDVSELEAQLERRLAVLVDGPRDMPPQQQTLRATIDWSVQRLRPAARELFARTAVFEGGAMREAVAAVCAPAAGALEELMESSLVAADAHGRLSMLETVREHATELLASSGGEASLARRHAMEFLRLAEAAEERLGADQALPDALERDLPNLRRAIAWGLEHERALAQRLLGALWRFWELRNHEAEAATWFARALAVDEGPAEARAKCCYGWGRLLLRGREFAVAEELFARAVELAAPESLYWIRGQVYLGWARFMQDDLAEAEAPARTGVEAARRRGDPELFCEALNTFAAVRFEHPESPAALRELEVLGRRHGIEHAIALGRSNLARHFIRKGDFARAGELAESAIPHARRVGDRWFMAQFLLNRSLAALCTGDRDTAATYLLALLDVAEEHGYDELTGEALVALAALAWPLDRDLAAQLLATGRHHRRTPIASDRAVERHYLPEWDRQGEPLPLAEACARARELVGG